jgi:hypothetical protein
MSLATSVDPTHRQASLRASVSSDGRKTALARTAVKLLPWETTPLPSFAFSGQPGVSLDVGQLIGLPIANVLIVVYLVVVACTGGRRSAQDYVAATEVCPSMAERDH